MKSVNKLSAKLTRHYRHVSLENNLLLREQRRQESTKISVFLRYMDPLQAEFLAENLLISIRPNFSENKICLISVSSYTYSVLITYSNCQGDYGPFNPLVSVGVPLWLGVNLKQRQKCRIEAPEWLCVG